MSRHERSLAFLAALSLVACVSPERETAVPQPPIPSTTAPAATAPAEPAPEPQQQPAPDPQSQPAPESARAAERETIDGLPNFARVSPTLWRGAQPTKEGLRELERMGVKTVISLRAFHSDELPSGSKLRCESISFKSWHPEDEDVVRFLRIANDPAKQPVFVHCQWGADRTGMMVALYRVAFCGWTKDDALREMTEGGYGFHSTWQNLVEYVRRIDVAVLASKAGVGSSTR